MRFPLGAYSCGLQSEYDGARSKHHLFEVLRSCRGLHANQDSVRTGDLCTPELNDSALDHNTLDNALAKSRWGGCYYPENWCIGDIAHCCVGIMYWSKTL